MIDITVWMKNFLQTLNETFGDRVWFVGLQGSYGRGEATETSDIDVVVLKPDRRKIEIQPAKAESDRAERSTRETKQVTHREDEQQESSAARSKPKRDRGER